MAEVKAKQRRLGRGLNALLEDAAGLETARDPAQEALRMVALDDLQAGRYQPRTRMDEGALLELAESIKSQGVMQPILVRERPVSVDGPRYEIIAGERRTRAARLAGLSEVPVLVREVADEAVAVMALIENIQREDLNPLEEAQGLQRLLDDFGMTHEQAAQAVGRSRSATSNVLRLLNLTQPVQVMLMAGDIDMGHARALLAVTDGAEQIRLANEVVAKRLTVRKTEALVQQHLSPSTAKESAAKAAPEKHRDVVRLEERLADRLTAPAEIRWRSERDKTSGAQTGEIVLKFVGLDGLGALLEKLGIAQDE
ncbi:ParB/RepB/Spo0J family partition protein [Amphibiibacter pelophylacis]|uniref:ParB/RepB/Spo0J family partition protein n=1 Tax=Amphibiibacter pelophylacis TaxID=1799477 RepID=A0ACC6P1K8_9BURK